MARLVYGCDTQEVTVAAHATTWTALMTFTAPASQKLAVRVSLFGKGASSDPSVQYAVRRTSDLTGATVAALTVRKVNSQDAETPSGIIKKFTVQPTTVADSNGTTVPGCAFTRKPNESVVSPQFIVNGGEVCTLWAKTTTTAAPVDVVPVVEE